MSQTTNDPTAVPGGGAPNEEDPLDIPEFLKRNASGRRRQSQAQAAGGVDGPTGSGSDSTSAESHLNSIHKIKIRHIKAGAPTRTIKPHTVEALAESFRCLGQIHPIHLNRIPDDQLKLVTGHHRLQAAKDLGWEEIDAIIVDLDEVETEILQIDENLVRAELTELEFAEQLQRRKELFDLKGGEKIRTPGGEQRTGFDKATGSKIGRSKSTIQKARKRAAAIPAEVRDAIRGTPAADKGAELDALASMSEKDQKRAVKLYNDQEANSIREARSRIEVKPGLSQEERDENDFERIRDAWEKSGEGGQRKFDSWRAKSRDLASGRNSDGDEVPAAGSDKGHAGVRPGDIDVDKMRKNDMLQFVVANKLKTPNFHGLPTKFKKAWLKKHLQENDPPEGGWILPEKARSQ